MTRLKANIEKLNTETDSELSEDQVSLITHYKEEMTRLKANIEKLKSETDSEL